MWSIFEHSTALEEETISNAFSSRAIFKIRADALVRRTPTILSSVENNRMVIALDESLVLLEDELCAQCSILNFNADIDVIGISPTGNFFVCGLKNGDIHGIFVKGVPLFNRAINAEDVSMSGRTFVCIQQIDGRFYLCCSNGRVYCLSEVDETPLLSQLNISIGENEQIESLWEHVCVQRLEPGFKCGAELTSAILLTSSEDDDIDSDACKPSERENAQLQLVAGAQNDLYFSSGPDNVVKNVLPAHFGGIKRIYNLENYILALSHTGHLLELCPFTKTFALPDTAATLLIEDMIIMECSDENIELLILTKATPSEQRLMKIIEYPSFKCHNELEVCAHAWLVQQPKSAVNLYYISGKSINEEQLPSEVEMILVSETDPCDRFKKLIAKGHLEEAEEFGKQFELCLQPVFESKAKRILHELGSMSDNNPEQLEKHFSALLVQLSIIEDRTFFHSNRMINMPTRNLMKRFLKEILKHLDEKGDEYHVLEIHELLHRLETLTIIDPYECNMEWQKFVHHANLVKIIVPLFKTDVPTACLVWKRHAAAIMPQLTEEALQQLLGLIPQQTEAFHLLLWLREFLPTVCGTHPSLMPFIADWSIEKTHTLQYAAHWPEIGLEFATKVSELFEEIQFMHSDMRRQHERNIGRLRHLVNALQDLSVLKKSFNLIFTLDNYLKDSIDETTICILQRVHLDSLKRLVNDFLYPIYQEKGRTPVDAIRHYIALVVANRSALSTWLERSVACVELLHNEDDRLECAVLVVQSSPIPWPEAIAPLLKLRASTHPLAKKLATEYEMQVIKMMKVKYGWEAESGGADFDLQLFMLRIVRVDLPEMVSDLRTLTKAAPEIAIAAYYNCCQQLVRRGRLEEAYEIFKMLLGDKNGKIAFELIELFASHLETCSLPSPSGYVKSTISFYKLVTPESRLEEYKHRIEFYRLMVPHAKSAVCGHRMRLLAIEQRFILHTRFQLNVSGGIEALATHTQRLQLLDAGIARIRQRSQETAVNVVNYFGGEIAALCAALQWPRVDGVRRLCAHMHCLPLSCALAYNVLECTDCNVAANCDDVVELALELLVQQIVWTKQSAPKPYDRDALAFPLAYELLVRASLALKNAKMTAVIELVKYVRIVRDSYSLDAIAFHYAADGACQVDANIRQALEAAEEAVHKNSTLDCSALDEKDMVSTVAPTAASAKKRPSMSAFDDIEVHVEQPQRKTNNSEQLVRFVSRTLLMLLSDSAPSNSLLQRMQQLLPQAMSDDVERTRTDFCDEWELLIKSKMYDEWFVMAQYMLDYQRQHLCDIINAEYVEQRLGRILRHALTQKDIDLIDLYAMLVTHNQPDMQLEKLSNELKTDQQKMNLLALAEIYYGQKGDESHHLDTLRAKRLKHYYYMEFCKQDPTIRGKFNADFDNIEKLLKQFHNKQLDVDLLKRMSHDFCIDYQQMLITLILSILHAQELQYDVENNSFGDEELVVLSTVEHIRQLCQAYVDEVKLTEVFASKLKHFISEIDMYFYELYLSVIELLCFLDAMPKEMQVWTSILQFLKYKMNTRRRSRASQLETDMWFQSQADIGVLPKISRYRFPFKPIVEQPLKDILDVELSVDNCESWFPLIQMHTQLKGSSDVDSVRDFFCMTAVKNSIPEYKAKNESNGVGDIWHLQPTNNAFLQAILRLIKHVNNPAKAFMILYFVSHYAPDGADQVEATYECYKYGCAHEAQIADSKYKEQLAKLKRKYPLLKTQHLLNVYGLSDEKLMRLVEHPNELILKLYHHEVILRASKLDINAVVNEIAQLHNLDVEVVQYQLLQKWLSFTLDTMENGTTELEETFFEEHNSLTNAGASSSGAPSDANADNAAQNVIRANYILNSWPKKNAIQFLVAHIFPADGTVNTTQQLQMYECFSKLNDGSDSFKDLLSQRQFITIKCVHELKQLGYNASLEKFAACNKLDILETIWKRNAQNPHSLEIMANICIGYDIYHAKVWNGILRRMTIFHMGRQLNALVDMLSCQPMLLNTDGLTAAWQYVLVHPFKNANQMRSFPQEELLSKTLFRLQSCPVLHKLDLVEFAEICLSLERVHMAAVVMALCQQASLRQQMRDLIAARKVGDLRKQILELEDAGILTVILNIALHELDL